MRRIVCFSCAIMMIIVLIGFFIYASSLNLSITWLTKNSLQIHSITYIYLMIVILLFFVGTTEK